MDSTDALSCTIYIIGRAGASPPSRTTGPRCLYICIYIYIYYIHVGIHVPIRIHNYAWCIWATVYQSQQAFIMNSDERGSQTSQKKRSSGC